MGPQKKVENGKLLVTLGRAVFVVVICLPVFSAARKPGDPSTQQAPATTGRPSPDKQGANLGSEVYKSQCSVCHGPDRKGNPPTFPSLIGEQKRLTDAQVTEIIHNGKGRMPAFPTVDGARLAALLEFLKTEDADTGAKASSPQFGNHAEVAGAKIYEKNCAICHGDDLLGAPSNYPGLAGVRGRLSDQQILANIHNGKGRMPAFKNLSEADDASLLRFLGDKDSPKQ